MSSQGPGREIMWDFYYICQRWPHCHIVVWYKAKNKIIPQIFGWVRISLGLKNTDIKLLKRNMELVELPYESKPTLLLLLMCLVLVYHPETTITAAIWECLL